MVEFEPRKDCDYRYDYLKIFQDIARGELPAIPTYRQLIVNDLFFVVYFVMQVPIANHPFVVEACKDVENGPKDYTFDAWAREHFKSTIITTGETIQKHCRDAETCIGIFSHTRPIAKGFLRALKSIYETNDILKQCFPEVFWKNPQSEAPKWSEDDGLVLKRTSNRREASLEAWGLIEGMPTGKHFDHRIYDDIETDDVVGNPQTVKKLRYRFNLSHNLGTSVGTHRVVGTFYSHEGLLTYIRDLESSDGVLIYTTRIKAATNDGSPYGDPVFLPQNKLDKLRVDEYSFSCQQLLNPTPIGVRKLSGDLFKVISHQEIPTSLNKFMLVDPAGDSKDGRGDSWAYGVFGAETTSDDLGQINVHCLDLVISPMRTEAAVEDIVRMYLRNGFIQALGVEKVGISTMEVHIAQALRDKGRILSVDNKSLVLLKPAGRNKIRRIEAALAFPLHHGKLYISDLVAKMYIDRLKQEADKFPYWHDDGLDIFAYLYDLLGDPTFRFMNKSRWNEPVLRAELGIV